MIGSTRQVAVHAFAAPADMRNYAESIVMRTERMRSGSVGPYIDGFATALAEGAYSPHTIRGYIRAAVHLGRWVDRRGIELSTLDDGVLEPFRRHLSRCRCFKRSKCVFKGAVSGAEQLLAYLRRRGAVAPVKAAAPTTAIATISERFATWMLRHRGVAPSTISRYQLALRPFLAGLGEDPAGYNATRIRAFVVEQLGTRGL